MCAILFTLNHRDPPDKPHLYSKEWVVCILLECILILQFFCRKLHGNERISTLVGASLASLPLDPPMLQTKFSQFFMVFLQ